MHSLSASVVSLHTHVGSPKNAKKTINSKPSIMYFLALFYTFLSMGFGTGLIGPTLLKLGEQTNSSLERVVYILFTRSFGFLIGTLFGGTVVDYFPLYGATILSFAILMMCISTILIPFMYHLISMIFVHLMWSFTAGIVDNLAQILTLRHYEKSKVNPYLQALHGAFGIGALFSPLIVAPFLQKHRPIDQWHYAYWLIGCLHIPNFVWIFIYAIRDELCSKKVEELNLEDKEFIPENKEFILENKEFVPENKDLEVVIISNEKSKSSDASSLKNMLILGLITVFLLLYVGSESAFGAYLHTYAFLHLKFEKDIAAYLNSAFWTSFAIGRICGIPLSLKFSSLQMIFSDLIGCIASLALLFILNKSSLILWVGSILFGFSVASIYPSAIAYTEKHIPITGKRMSVLAVGGASGDAIIPLLIGYSMNSKLIGTVGFIIVSFVVVGLASLLFVFIVLYLRHQSKKDEPNVK